MKNRITKSMLAGIVGLAINSGCANRDEVKFNDYSLAGKTYNYVIEKAEESLENPRVRYEKWLDFLKRYDENKDHYLSMEEAKKCEKNQRLNIGNIGELL